MYASPYGHALMNLCQFFPEDSIYYLTNAEALQRLREMSHEDFGGDARKWEAWGKEHDMFLSTWGGLDGILHETESEEPRGGEVR